jgi:hypothetical protein
MMTALEYPAQRGTSVDVETLEVPVIFSGASLLLSLVAAMILGSDLVAALY